jgi:tripartite-type tricarboxylate transporter receptor subunit TctC
MVLPGLGSAPAQQSYPSRPVTMITPFAAGGPTDVLARIVGDRMGRSLGQTVVIENVSGAGGTLGVGRVVRAAADGYTLSIGPWNSHVVNGAVYPLQYDLLKDLDPVALLANNHSMILSKADVPAKDLGELIAWIRQNPDKLSAGTSGVGASTHVAGILFQQLTGTRFQFVPYRGASPALQDVMAGRIELMFDQSSNCLPYVRSGKVKAYAVAARTRLAAAPDIPTVDEAGLPGFYLNVWYGLWVPAGTPKHIVARLNAAVVDALSDPDVRRRLADLGIEIPPPEQLTPEALGSYQRAEIEKWWPIVKSANIRAE